MKLPTINSQDAQPHVSDSLQAHLVQIAAGEDAEFERAVRDGSRYLETFVDSMQNVCNIIERNLKPALQHLKDAGADTEKRKVALAHRRASYQKISKAFNLVLYNQHVLANFTADFQGQTSGSLALLGALLHDEIRGMLSTAQLLYLKNQLDKNLHSDELASEQSAIDARITGFQSTIDKLRETIKKMRGLVNDEV